jgi:hypothetical protein
MKKIIKFFGSALLVSILFAACKKQISEIQYLGGTSPVLTASSTTPIVLNIANKNNDVLKFTWTNPNYQFTTGISSQDVSYTLQVDTTGANFTGPLLSERSISKELSLNLTVGDLDQLLANWQEEIPRSRNFDFRIKSTMANGSAILYSNVIKITVTPYLDVVVTLPFTSNLFLIGNATPGGDATGWNNPVPVPSQQFTKVGAGVYQLTTPLIGGKQYLVIPDNGSWSNKYAVKAGEVTADGGPFGYNFGDNFPGPATSGTYKIVLNFKSGRFTVTKL